VFRLEIAGIHLRGGGEFGDGRNPSAYRCMDYMSSNRARCPTEFIFRRLVPSLPSSPLLEVFKGGAAVGVVPPFTLYNQRPYCLSSRPDFDNYKLRRDTPTKKVIPYKSLTTAKLGTRPIMSLIDITQE